MIQQAGGVYIHFDMHMHIITFQPLKARIKYTELTAKFETKVVRKKTR